MDFTLSYEQALLRDNLNRFLHDRYTFEARRAASRSEPGWRQDMWRAFAELGILGATVPRRCGGLGGGPIEAMLIMEELGGALVLEPFLETVVIGCGLLRESENARADDEMSRIAAGDSLVAFGWAEPNSRYSFSEVSTSARRAGAGWRLNGYKSVVSAAPWATQLIVTARTSGGPSEKEGVSLFLLERDSPGLALSEYSTIDGRRAADIRFDEVALPAEALLGDEGKAIATLERVGDEALAALAAEAVGVMRRILKDTVDYTKQRKQFGQTIASFQVLQHRMVDMFLQIEMAMSATHLVTLSLDGGARERAKAASAAKVTVGNACRFVGQNAIQLHGGMGMSDEVPVTHYFRRATVIEGQFGTVEHHLARFAELAELDRNQP